MVVRRLEVPMPDQTRICLMAKAAAFEKENGRELEQIRNVFRSDYISMRMMKNVLRMTIAFLLGLFLWICHDIDAVMAKLGIMDIRGMVIRICAAYGIVIAVSLSVTYYTASRDYFRGRKKQQKFLAMLEKLPQEPEQETDH